MYYVQVYNPLTGTWRRSRLSEPCVAVEDGLRRVAFLNERLRGADLKFRLVDESGHEVKE